jgi:hypothetical protein
MGFLIARPLAKPGRNRAVVAEPTQESWALQHPMLPQFHPGELQDLQSAVRTWLSAYRKYHNPETVSKRQRMAPLLQKLEGMA